jgi:hypothetical protein
MSDQTGSRAGLDVVLPVSDFPDWLNPVFVRDLRQGLRSSFFIWAFVSLQAVAILTALMEWAMAQFFGGSGGPLLAGASTMVTSLIFSFFLPLSLFHSLQPELGRGRNAELLLTSRLSRWQIVRGKLLVATTLSALLLVSLLPYFLIRYFLGRVEPVGLMLEMMNLLIANAVMNAIVIGASAFSSHLVRFGLIFFLMVFHSGTAAAYIMRRNFSGGVPGGFLPDDFAGQVLAAALYILLCLQLGRARLQSIRQVVDPVATILVFALLAPIAHGILVASAGPLFAILFLCLMIAVALLLDRDAPRKKS